MKLLSARTYPYVIKDIIKNKDYIFKKNIVLSGELQRVVVSSFGCQINCIIDTGIVPSEDVQVLAVSNNCCVLENIISADIIPSERVQEASVSNYGKSIYYIVKAGIVVSKKFSWQLLKMILIVYFV